MANHNELGKLGEEKAVAYLIGLGYIILERNWRAKKYELDIVAQDGDELVFVEVKTRSSSYFGEPEEFLSEHQQKHLVEGANYYIEQNEIDLESRFDVLAVIKEQDYNIKHIKYAF